MIKLIATDLDGTLLSEGSIVPRRNIEALQRAMAAGVRVVLCTGRMVDSTIPIAEQLGGVNAPISVFNGAMVYDIATDTIMSGETVSVEDALEVIRALQARGIYTQVFPARKYYHEKPTRWTDFYSARINVTGVELDRPLLEWLDQPVYKVHSLGEPDELEAAVRELSPLFPRLTLVKSSANTLEVIAKGVDKGKGLRDVCAQLGIAPEETIAFGDELNDLPLLLAAGEGYAMENAVHTVREQVKFIAPRNTDCGVARIVEQYLDEGKMGGTL